MKVIECVCADETVHRLRIEARFRNIDGMPDITWVQVLQRRVEYQTWTDTRLALDTSARPVAHLLAEALIYVRAS
jgi:hypothetical protein